VVESNEWVGFYARVQFSSTDELLDLGKPRKIAGQEKTETTFLPFLPFPFPSDFDWEYRRRLTIAGTKDL
jgi:hypothetical protein